MKDKTEENSKQKDNQEPKNSGSSKEKASFDQNGKGASEKFGEAGGTPNESGEENGAGTVKKNRNQ
ncbi:hypothetical protein [Pedobacter nototheniae]|uniref:hypothetical protein n=1 Tax=Pedobacter nototheniae TaxID=2488994 RepID=UPI00293053FE|nr:hypothetical protein [Pedobacter nototheniae]